MLSIVTLIAKGISIILFFWYGMSCLFTSKMVSEFERYRLARFRVLTGTLQVAACFGIVAGHFYRPLLLLSAGGLATMMFLAVITRFRIQDPAYAALPAFALCLLNLFILATAL
jgi:hypothetical protein